VTTALTGQAGLPVKATTHDVWEAIRKVQLSTDQVKEANVECLWREFGDIAFKSGENVEDFAQRINNLVSQLLVLDDDITSNQEDVACRPRQPRAGGNLNGNLARP
jgi:hypothetical protein